MAFLVAGLELGKEFQSVANHGSLDHGHFSWWLALFPYQGTRGLQTLSTMLESGIRT
ncbi:UNVERIFIED_CONTAM: hypothetical protein Slati_4423600 [Sesamum latifolium]|uniref:Uncharacterized protein n=1 Tax=Sesamum latifolium TaxID=2727402 RepID=A0AAW2SQ55_9LAMI